MGIEVFRDSWGIPHLRAGGPHELAFAQGHNAAIDRAWQIEVERHRAQGTTAAFLGAGAVGWDRFARQARLDDTAERCFRRLDADTGRWVTSYVDGVNAGLGDGARRAPEFAATGLVPGRWQPWTPLALWLSRHILFTGTPAKLWREEVTRRLGAEAVRLFAADGPDASGSNGWLVAGHHTVSGAALIAGDPHRPIEDPGVYQQVHLACPEYDVVGMAVPGVPGTAHFGHTGDVAWAITNAMADYQDLYRERLRRRGDGVRAYGPDGWRPTAAHVEIIEVAGAEPVEVEVIETERGPVVIGGPGDPVAISLRCPPRVREEVGFEVLPALLRARTVADVDRAVDRWVEPVNVLLAADTSGGLLHRVAGAVPRRHHENSLRVVPAWEPAHEWRGWHAPMPHAAVDGVAVMANQRGLAEPLGVEFASPHRANRIRDLLDASTGRAAADTTAANTTAADMTAIHTDTYLSSARPVLELLAGLDDLGPDAARLRDRLLRWDRRMAAGSSDATVYTAVRAALVHRLAAHPALAGLSDPAVLSAPSAPAEPAEPAEPVEPSGSAEPTPYPEIFQPWLDPIPRIAHALEALLTDGFLPVADRVALVQAAVEDVAATGEPTETWGEAHRLMPWRALPDPAQGGWAGLSGDHDCVLATSSVPGITHHAARGPVARYVWDLARREDSMWVVPFGASGVPGTAHHRDQLPHWLRGTLVPVVTDWDRLTREHHTP